MKLTPLLVVALASATGCRPTPLVGPTAADPQASARPIADALGEAGVTCEVTKGSFVHCNVDGADLVAVVSLASTGRQLTLMIPVPQPACATAEFHARIAKFNADYILVTAGCVDAKTLILGHRTHLFRPGLDKADLVDVVKKWVPTAVGVASQEGLLAPPAAEPPGKAPKGTEGKI